MRRLFAWLARHSAATTPAPAVAAPDPPADTPPPEGRLWSLSECVEPPDFDSSVYPPPRPVILRGSLFAAQGKPIMVELLDPEGRLLGECYQPLLVPLSSQVIVTQTGRAACVRITSPDLAMVVPTRDFALRAGSVATITNVITLPRDPKPR